VSCILPIEQNTDVVTLTIELDGNALPGHVPVHHVEVLRQVNRIPYARLRVADGDPSIADFAVSSAEFFAPGQAIVISAGYHGTTEVVFEGIVVKQRVGVRRNASWLEVECRDVASKMTLTRRHRLFVEVTDSDVVEELLGEYGIDAEIATTEVTHGQLVQYQATDWDFMISRLEANGQFCAVENGAVRSFVPSLDDPSDAEIVFGVNLLELDAEFDARSQAQSITARAWDPAAQALQEIDAADPGWAFNSNLTSDDMVGATGRDSDQVWHGGALAADALQAWADGALLRSRIAGFRGRVRFRGVSALRLGQAITLAGLGDRFSGEVLATGIRHEFVDNDWCTDVEFGADSEYHARQFDVSALPAAGLTPAVAGLQTGIVTAITEDPAGEHRIRVKIPVSGMDEEGVWARLATLDAGNARGTYFRPEVDDEVVVGFFHDDPAFPVVLGMLHSSALPPPEEAAEDNHLKGYTSRGNLKLVFDDENGVITIETPEGNSLLLTDGEGGITLSDQNGNSLVMNSDGIELSSAGDIKVAANGDIGVEGINTELKGSAAFKAEGSSSAQLSSSGTLTVSGSLVQIN
jgi:Rhs element Vgr protein